jgi:hypothetical protein
VGHTPPNPHGMPYEDQQPIFLLRKPREPLEVLWQRGKLYI